MALDKDSASQKLIDMLGVYMEMEPGEAKTEYWEEIRMVMADAADELHEVANQRPSAYILADGLREYEKTIDKAAPKKPSLWRLFFSRKK